MENDPPGGTWRDDCAVTVPLFVDTLPAQKNDSFLAAGIQPMATESLTPLTGSL